MIRNNNDAVIRKMARTSLKSGKRRTFTLFLAICLSAFLVFTVFTVGITFFKMQRVQNLRMAGGKYDAVLYGLTDRQREICENSPDIQCIGIVGVCGFVEETKEDSTPNAGLAWADDTYWQKIKTPAVEKQSGHYPKAFDEVMATREALKECGYENLGVGDSFEMTYATAKGTYTDTFKISGIWEGYGDTKTFHVSKDFFDKAAGELSDVTTGRCFIDFKKNIITRKEQEVFTGKLKLGKQQNLFFLSNYGNSVQIFAGLLGLVVVTCLCAYLLVYNIMYLSVAGRIRYFGLLQTVGMTGRQVKKLMRKQLVWLGASGSVCGVILGSIVSFFLIPSVVKAMGIRTGVAGKIMVTFHPAILMLAVVLVGVTVYLAGRKPTRMAVAVMPVEALGYRPAQGSRIRRRAGEKKVVRRMAWEQFSKDKKRTAVVLCSLAVSLSVYLCMTTLLESQAARTIVSNYMDMDLVLKNDTGYKEKAEDRKQIFDDSLIDAVRENEGVKEVHTMLFAEITAPWEDDFIDMWMEEFYAMYMREPFDSVKEEYKEHPENFGTSMIGIDEGELAYLNETLSTPVDEDDFLSGKTCIIFRNGLDFESSDLKGKKVTCAEYADRENTKTFEIAGLTDENYYTALLGYPPTIIVSDRVVKDFVKEPVNLKLGVKYEKEYDRETEKAVLSIFNESPYPNDYSYESKIEEADGIKKAQGNMLEVGVGIVLILALIGVMNYVNTFAGNIQNRMAELSILESIGMTGRQIRRMLMREGLLYALGAWLVTATAGLGVTYRIYQSMNYRNVDFSVPLFPLLAAIALSAVICMAVPVVTYGILEKKGSIVERIRTVE